jgi:hypothetical protein
VGALGLQDDDREELLQLEKVVRHSPVEIVGHSSCSCAY